MRQTVLQTLLAITTMAALAMATSCFSDLSGDFQQLEATEFEPVKILDITTDGTAETTDVIYGGRKVAQKFNLAQSYQIQGALVKLVRVGDWSEYPDAKIWAQIFPDSANEPSGSSGSSLTSQVTVANISEDVPVDESDFVPFPFSLKPTLSSGDYWFVLSLVEGTGGDSIDDYLEYYENATGVGISYYNSSWSTQTNTNLSIVIWAKQVAP